MKQYRERIGEKLKDIDIGILILNAGWREMSPFICLSDDEIEQHVNINVG